MAEEWIETIECFLDAIEVRVNFLALFFGERLKVKHLHT